MTRTVWDLHGDDRNADPFRFAILGFDAIDKQLNAALAEAFGGELPEEIRMMRWKARVGLADALTLLPVDIADPLGRLAKVRDDFAHGRIDDLDDARAAELKTSIRQLAPTVDSDYPTLLKDMDPFMVLSTLFLFVQEALTIAIDEAREQRETREEAMREWWQRRRPAMTLTPEEVAELVRQAEETAD
jgi:hypothetical protein